MRHLILLFVLIVFGQCLIAQDTIKYLVITECRLHDTHRAYLELTNMGDKPIQLNQFEIGNWGGGATLVNGKTNRSADFTLPSYVLEPGKSFVLASIQEWGPEMFRKGLAGYPEKTFPDNLFSVTNLFMHESESPTKDPTDSITPNSKPFSEQWGGKNGFFISQKLPNGDSLVVDQVAGMFQGANGANLDRTATPAFDVAGVTAATENSYLIRKFTVKNGNLDFANARGVGSDDSEWIPIPFYTSNGWRQAPWTVGNHGDYKFDDKTLVSKTISVDITNKKLTVPWGTLRGDNFIKNFETRPGLGWDYKLNADPKDSLSLGAKTGDKLVLYVCGSKLEKVTFDIVVQDPTPGVNIVVPVYNYAAEGGFRNEILAGTLDWPRVTNNASGKDTIWGTRGGLPYSTRLDSLLERLEKPAKAKWEIIYSTGIKKPDLVNGDKLKVTAENGSIKEYYISVLPYRANNDAYLSSITWPDIPEFYKGIFGWKGDTIPSFGSQILNYNVEVPLLSQGIPALMAKPRDTKAKVNVTRAKSLSGSPADRTVNFEVIAEDDTTIINYDVVLRKETSPDYIQPNQAEPFFSEVIQNYGWGGNDALEICNPGNLPLDLSNYMIIGVTEAPAAAIAKTNATNFGVRYEKYIPGYKWAATEADWAVKPYLALKDLSVNPIVSPGDVFAMGSHNGGTNSCDDNNIWIIPFRTELDVQFANNVTNCYTYVNQWGETISENGTPFTKWFSTGIYLFKILNDSVKQGLKSAIDPNDFELIDVLGGLGKDWNLEGLTDRGNPFNFIRKPEITTGNTIIGGSFGTVGHPEQVEWNCTSGNYWTAKGEGWPNTMRYILNDLGKHYFLPPTKYMSTIGSLAYQVSEGYSMNEKIIGVKSGTTVADFLNNIIKADPGQKLTVKSKIGTFLIPTDNVNMGDSLNVRSADSTNTSQYVLNVTAEGFSSNAVLTSTVYKVEVTQNPVGTEMGKGLVGGIPYGTTLQTAISKIKIPKGATLTIIDGKGAYVAYKGLNFDTLYFNIKVNTNIYLEVIAENGVTGIVYQLRPDSKVSDAFVTSNIYDVDQDLLLIKLVPKGINTLNFLANVIPCLGAEIKVVDKLGNIRVDGGLADDDRIVVTSSDKTATATYYISTLDLGFGNNIMHFAYITSKVYKVSQIDYVVNGAKNGTTVADFLKNVVASTGAVVKVYNTNGTEKTSGTIAANDVVKVTNAIVSLETIYKIGALSVGNSEISIGEQILLYPNPTNGNINVTGLKNGQKLSVFNSNGAKVMQVDVDHINKQISIENQPAGIYMIVVTDQKQVIARYKAVKR